MKFMKFGEKDRPSMKFSKELTAEDHLHKHLIIAQNVCDVINCALCSKPRCVYANAKLNGNVKMNVDYLIADSEYACGGSFVDDESYLRHSVVVHR